MAEEVVGGDAAAAPVVEHQPCLSQATNTTEVVRAADGGLGAEVDEEEIAEIFRNNADASDAAHEPCADAQEEVLGDAEDVEPTAEDLQGEAHKILPDPGEPTAAEVEDHRACGHIAFRSWCGECVESRGVGEPHRTRKEQRIVCVCL